MKKQDTRNKIQETRDKKYVISVFGNEVDNHDNTVIQLVPLLRVTFPQVNFLIQDPTESIEPAGDPWIILDTAIGIDHVTLVTSLGDLEHVKGASVHDFDVYMDLRLRAKISPLPALFIILVPQGDNISHAAKHVVELLRQLAI